MGESGLTPSGFLQSFGLSTSLKKVMHLSHGSGYAPISGPLSLWSFEGGGY